jgi:hypothetical protein
MGWNSAAQERGGPAPKAPLGLTGKGKGSGSGKGKGGFKGGKGGFKGGKGGFKGGKGAAVVAPPVEDDFDEDAEIERRRAEKKALKAKKKEEKEKAQRRAQQMATQPKKAATMGGVGGIMAQMSEAGKGVKKTKKKPTQQPTQMSYREQNYLVGSADYAASANASYSVGSSWDTPAASVSKPYAPPSASAGAPAPYMFDDDGHTSSIPGVTIRGGGGDTWGGKALVHFKRRCGCLLLLFHWPLFAAVCLLSNPLCSWCWWRWPHCCSIKCRLRLRRL